MNNLLSLTCNDTIQIPLTNIDKFFLVDRIDYPLVSRHAWWINHGGYVTSTNIGTKARYVHREILFQELKKIKGNEVIDHIDRNKLNNSRFNLRIISTQLNGYNAEKQQRKVKCTSKYKGVSFDKSRNLWLSYVVVHRKMVNLGRFETEIEAAQARDRYMIKYYSQYACLNFPIETYL